MKRTVWRFEHQNPAYRLAAVWGPAYGDNEVEVRYFDPDGNLLSGTYMPSKGFINPPHDEIEIPFKPCESEEHSLSQKTRWDRFQGYLNRRGH